VGLVESQQKIGERIRHGGSFAQVKEEIIDPSPLNEVQKSALHFYAFSVLSLSAEAEEVRRLASPRPRREEVTP
jgi:hypothetical protein